MKPPPAAFACALLASALFFLPPHAAAADPTAASLESQLALAGDNRAQLERALRDAPEDQRPGLVFLLENMPERDLTSLSADYLLQNVRLSDEAKAAAPWGDSIPDDIFLDAVLPYATVNERRDDWRAGFRERFLPVVEGCATATEAAMRLNERVFGLVNVRYSTQRPKPDQSPLESIEAGLASCSGLSILLIDAARAVGIPARFVGTPRWTTKRGNHSWVEIWDGDWKFLGAAEPDPAGLNRGWFVGDASQADPSKPVHWIYATSFRRTGLSFPLVWDRSIAYVPAVDVTARYTALRQNADGKASVLFDVVDPDSKARVAAHICVRQPGLPGPLAEGRTRDAANDTNDILSFLLPPETELEIEIRVDPEGEPVRRTFRTSSDPRQRFAFPVDGSAP